MSATGLPNELSISVLVTAVSSITSWRSAAASRLRARLDRARAVGSGDGGLEAIGYLGKRVSNRDAGHVSPIQVSCASSPPYRTDCCALRSRDALRMAARSATAEAKS